MAGKPGRSGGARPGAGRKKRAETLPAPAADGAQPIDPYAGVDDPLEFLIKVQTDPLQDPKLRVRAAIAAAQYKHTKRGDGGKKDEAKDLAKKAGAGKFKAAPAPLKLVHR